MSYKDKDKQRKYQREWARKNGKKTRRAKLKKIRKLVITAKSVPCLDCGVQYPYYVMDLHHLDPETKCFSLNQHGNRGLAVIQAEILKCIVLCSNCHRIRTHRAGWSSSSSQLS